MLIVGARRIAAQAAIAATVTGAVAVAAWWAAGRERPLTPWVARARTTVHRVEARIAALEPGSARRGGVEVAEAEVAEAERITRAELARFPWSRDRERVATAWDRPLGTAFEALRAAGQRRRDVVLRWRSVASRADAASAAARRQAAAPGIGHSSRVLAQRAALDLDRARHLAARGAYADACRAAEASLGRSGRVTAQWAELYARFDDPEALGRWGRWIDQAIDDSRRGGGRVVIVDKLRHELRVYSAGRSLLELPVELGSRGLLDKRHAGDRATPEGRYRVVERRPRGTTRFYKALMLDYPNLEDRARFARDRGEIPPGVGIGSLIEIHGRGGRGRDWTDGCVALGDREMDRLFELVPVGTPVVIVGTRPGAES